MALAARSLGWTGDARDQAFFEWKHFENPFGESPSWAAFDGDRMVAFRTLMRWEFARGDERLRMVRAVDTATDPDYQGRGLFKRLTLRAVDELTAEGVDAVFNTPNDQSRPGYLKMGWSVVGRPTIHVSPRSPLTLAAMLRSRVPAEKWSHAPDVGVPICEVADQIATSMAGSGWETPRTAEFLRWRYGFGPLGYRVIEVKGGHCMFRVRNRGSLREVALCDWRSMQGDPAAVRGLVKAAGDYAVGLGLTFTRHASLPLPRQGPFVTWRPLSEGATPDLSEMNFALGDLELF